MSRPSHRHHRSAFPLQVQDLTIAGYGQGMTRVAIELGGSDSAHTHRAPLHHHHRIAARRQHPQLPMGIAPCQGAVGHVWLAHGECRSAQATQVAMPRQQPDVASGLDRSDTGSNHRPVDQAGLTQHTARALRDGIDAVVAEHIHRIAPESARIQGPLSPQPWLAAPRPAHCAGAARPAHCQQV